MASRCSRTSGGFIRDGITSSPGCSSRTWSGSWKAGRYGRPSTGSAGTSRRRAMSRSLGKSLPAGLRRLVAQRGPAALVGRAFPFVTLSADGSLHPMLCSYLEWLAVDGRRLRLVIAGGSRSARNLEERAAGTLLLVEPERTVYVKCRATGPPLRVAALAGFTLAVEHGPREVPGESEGGGGGPGPRGRGGDLARFTLAVDDVLEDVPDESEGDVRVVSGIRYAPPPALDDARVRAVLVALRMP